MCPIDVRPAIGLHTRTSRAISSTTPDACCACWSRSSTNPPARRASRCCHAAGWSSHLPLAVRWRRLDRDYVPEGTEIGYSLILANSRWHTFDEARRMFLSSLELSVVYSIHQATACRHNGGTYRTVLDPLLQGPRVRPSMFRPIEVFGEAPSTTGGGSGGTRCAPRTGEGTAWRRPGPAGAGPSPRRSTPRRRPAGEAGSPRGGQCPEPGRPGAGGPGSRPEYLDVARATVWRLRRDDPTFPSPIRFGSTIWWRSERSSIDWTRLQQDTSTAPHSERRRKPGRRRA